MASTGQTGAKKGDAPGSSEASISENLQELIRQLSPAEATDRELQQSEQTAWKTIRNHRYLITNSHEVNRNLDALVERLRVEDMSEFGNTLRELSDKVLEQLESHHHDTQNVHWSLLDFLFSLTHGPIQNIRRNWVLMNQQRLSAIAAVEVAERRSSSKDGAANDPIGTEVDWAALLREDFLQPAHSLGGSSDSLSEWSEEESDPVEAGVLESDTTPNLAAAYEQAMQAAIPCSRSASLHLPPGKGDEPKGSSFRIVQPVQFAVGNRQVAGLRLNKLPQLAPPLPPMAVSPYEESVRDEKLLPRTIHAPWWRQNVRSFALPADANHLENFAVTYVQFLNLQTLGLLELRPPNTTTEACLLREILFMFVRPASCGYFDFDKKTRSIQVRGTISIHTVTAGTLMGFLEVNVLPALEDMLELRHIIDEHTLFSDDSSTGTLECFAYGLRDLVQPISQLLVEYEDRESEASLIDFVAEFRQHFQRLHLLRGLAEDVILDEGPQHLRSSYLLSRLYSHTKPNVPHQKLATALLLVSLKRYCSIIDAWWRRATLEDRQNEFVVERCEPGDSSGYVRRRSVPSDVSPRVMECFRKLRHCPFYQILLEHALESGDTQDLLANVNLLGDMLANTNESQPRSLYDELAAQLFAQVRVYCGGGRPPEEEQNEKEEEPKEEEDEKAGQMADELLLSSVQGIRNLDLLHIFTRPARERLQESQERHRSASFSVQVGDVLAQLEDSTCLQLKAELPDALREILLRRQSLANEYAMRAYCEDLHLGDTISFLRHTLLLEAYYLLFPFYNRLFVRIETESGWARESQLSSELYELLLPAYPQCAGQLHVQVISQVACRSHNAYEALEALELVYDMPVALQRILTERHMHSYNAVWRLMMKVKWAVWKLENLSFLRRPKAEPYAPLDLHDLTIRRLEILRFWLIYLTDSLHSHIMGALAVKFERRIPGCKNIRELSAQHDNYVSGLLTRCLLTADFVPFRVALEQLFYLVFVLHMEWTACARHLGDSDALSLAMEDDDSSAGTRDEYLAHNQVAEIEATYIRCHQTLGGILHKLVYQQDHGFLTALEVAVNTSVPY